MIDENTKQAILKLSAEDLFDDPELVAWLTTRLQFGSDNLKIIVERVGGRKWRIAKEL